MLNPRVKPHMSDTAFCCCVAFKQLDSNLPE